jgi:ABC-2 type transport system permease protein
MKVNTNKRKNIIQLLMSLLIILLINFIGLFLFERFDLTQEKRHTIAPATKELIKNLDDIIYVKVYLEGDFPAGFKRLRNATKEMLDEFRAVSKENIEYEFINPSADPDEKKRQEIYVQLTKQGLQYTNLEIREGDGKSEKIIFPGAIVSYRDREVPVQLLKSQVGVSSEEMLNNSVQQLEFELANTIKKITTIVKPAIAFIEGHGEADTLSLMDAKNSLSEYYDVDRVRIEGRLSALKGYKAIIIADPDSAFNEKDKFIIDQFIMNGGRALWLLSNVEAEMDSLSNKSVTYALNKDLNLDDMLFRYGVRMNYNLVQDLQAAPIPVVTGYIGNQPKQQLFPWYYFPLLMPQSNHSIVKNLNAVKIEFTGTIDTVGDPQIKKTPLLLTSKYSRVLNAPVRVSVNSLREEPNISSFNKPFQPVAYLLEGSFESVFTNRLSPMLLESEEFKFIESGIPSKMIVVSGGSVIKNHYQRSTGRVYPLGYDKFTGQIYGNKNFILNAVNYLCDDSGLIEARSKEIKLRVLDVEKLKQKRFFMQLFNTGAPVLIILVAGLILFRIRKRKYAH